MDLLLGLGGFERGSDFAWQSAYSGSDYDWSANCAWVNPNSNPDWKTGYDVCTTNDTIAVGWRRISSISVNPANNQVFKLVDGQGISSSKAQYLALRNTTGSAYTMLRFGRPVYTSLNHEPKEGDTVVFRIDSVRMAGFGSLPTGAVISPCIQLSFSTSSNSDIYTRKFVPSTTSSSVEVSGVVPSGVTNIMVQFRLDVNANLSGKEVGAYIDGAHIYIKRSATPTEYATWEIPASKPRSIKTILKYFDPKSQDIYETAQNFDYILSSDSKHIYNEQFRAINPNVKILSYKTTAITKNDSLTPGLDPWYSDAGVQYNYAVKNHPEWLYSDGNGGYATQVAYPNNCYAHVENQDYQKTWAANTIKTAQRNNFDGVFVDDLNYQTGNGVTINPVDCQRFMHEIMPLFKAAELHVQRNGVMHLAYQNTNPIQNMGWIINNPFFTVSSSYPASSGYSNNSPSSVSDTYFQEYAFIRVPYTVGVGFAGNVYSKEFWLAQLQDMDLLATWNTGALASHNTTKLMAMHTYGVDQKSDPAEGLDGWMHFGLTSYLLAQNDYTMFGSQEQTDYAKVLTDYSVTKQLGAPDGTHFAYGGDIYCQYRRYKANDDGGVGGIVIVNANSTTSRTYTIDFDATDESGNAVSSGSRIKLAPHTGRIYFQRQQMSVSLSTSSNTVYAAQTITVTVNYTNQGSQKLSNVTLRVQVPNEMTYVTGSAEKSGGTYYSSTKTIVWTISSVVANGHGSRTFMATIK
ncbi:MAG: putative glycoside hydrolase [Armatimonadota bacterium]